MEVLDTAGIQRNRGVKKGTQTGESSNYYINVHSDMPSCIVEMGFINDASDNQLFDEKLDAYAAAIGDAVLATAETYRANKVTDGNGQGAGEAGSGTGDGQGTVGTETAPETIRARMEREMTPETDRGRTKQEAAPETVRVLQVEMRRCRRLRLTGWIPPCRAGGWEATPMRTTARTMQSVRSRSMGITMRFSLERIQRPSI